MRGDGFGAELAGMARIVAGGFGWWVHITLKEELRHFLIKSRIILRSISNAFLFVSAFPALKPRINDLKISNLMGGSGDQVQYKIIDAR